MDHSSSTSWSFLSAPIWGVKDHCAISSFACSFVCSIDVLSSSRANHCTEERVDEVYQACHLAQPNNAYNSNFKRHYLNIAHDYQKHLDIKRETKEAIDAIRLEALRFSLVVLVNDEVLSRSVNDDESYEKCTSREVFEETNIVINNSKYIYKIEIDYEVLKILRINPIGEKSKLNIRLHTNNSIKELLVYEKVHNINIEIKQFYNFLFAIIKDSDSNNFTSNISSLKECANKNENILAIIYITEYKNIMKKYILSESERDFNFYLKENRFEVWNYKDDFVVYHKLSKNIHKYIEKFNRHIENYNSLEHVKKKYSGNIEISFKTFK
ncbi:1477_t:CDS:2 [Scutellospora calospora]|uniref:1477_t:CDS:1 n=1 Tax=Scutellospora calospora TaxID=85575 RepID=A0ACA9JUY7_9GLOM|nr:1477_t:CDS:2 [Scutellospora calospora]